jgi:hypothetical protein
MPIFHTVLVHAGRPGQFKKVSLKPLNGHELKNNNHRERT